MLKIYNAVGENGKVVLKRGIKFNYERFDTGMDGYGTIVSGRSECKRADYLLEDLTFFKEYVKKIDMMDGFIKNNSMILYNPYSLDELVDREKNGQIEKDLDEQGVLLFTDYVCLDYNRDRYNVERLMGRFPETGAYILLPGAEIEMSFPAYLEKSKDSYEVLESGRGVKQLYLTKVDRRKN